MHAGWKLKGNNFCEKAGNLRRTRRPHSRAVLLKVWYTFGAQSMDYWYRDWEQAFRNFDTCLVLLWHFRICYFSRNSFLLYFTNILVLCQIMKESSSFSTGGMRIALGNVLCSTGDHYQLWRGQVTSLRWVSGSERHCKVKWESLNELTFEHMCVEYKGFDYFLCAKIRIIWICLCCICDTH